MPNVLAHLGAQGLISKASFRHADWRWIFVGCIVPDVPWIAQRAIRTLSPAVDPYELRVYAIVQSSLIVSLFLCAALSTLSAMPRRTFALLSVNVLLHLLLDSLQTKFANGVHLFAPFSWELLNLGLFWPESLASYLLIALGIVVSLYAWRESRGEPLVLRVSPRRLALASLLLAAWSFAPLLLRHGPIAADNHFVRTLRLVHERSGRPVEFDRAAYVRVGQGDYLKTFAGEELQLDGSAHNASATVSVRGRFVDSRTVQVLELHEHRAWARDLGSYVGLAFVGLFWLRGLWCQFRPIVNR